MMPLTRTAMMPYFCQKLLGRADGLRTSTAMAGVIVGAAVGVGVC
jgi:hypothetical protein